MPFRPPFVTAGKRLVENKMSCRIKLFFCYFINLYNTLPNLPRPTFLDGRHASDWGDSLNRRRRGGEWNTIVMMFVGGVVLMFDGFLELFLPLNIYGAGVFFPARTLIGG
jgi:hypothetical protein